MNSSDGIQIQIQVCCDRGLEQMASETLLSASFIASGHQPHKEHRIDDQPVVTTGLCLERCQDPQMITAGYFALETYRVKLGSPWGEAVLWRPHFYSF